MKDFLCFLFHIESKYVKSVAFCKKRTYCNTFKNRFMPILKWLFPVTMLHNIKKQQKQQKQKFLF